MDKCTEQVQQGLYGPRGGYHGFEYITKVVPDQYTIDWKNNNDLPMLAKAARKSMA